jgi:branched-chain amino acid transport system ATP-binding protein
MLFVKDIDAYYGDSHILRDVCLTVKAGEVVCLLGRNGAGKTTTLLTIMGYLKPRSGSIAFRGMAIDRLPPHKIARLGLGFVPQERHIFPSLTVYENLTVAARAGGSSGAHRWNLTAVFERFPRLKERQNNLGWQLSGGEQQILSIARALMLNPTLLLLDEPSEGLAPLIVREIVEVIEQLKKEGLAVLLVEQAIAVALRLADRHHVISKGRICFTGTSAELAQNVEVKKTYLTV